MAYLLDTDIVIYWLTDRYSHLRQKMALMPPEQLHISAITVAELYFGAYNSARPRENCALLAELLPELTVLDFDSAAGIVFGQLKAELKRNGQLLNDSDLLIAATALAQNLVLVTNNIRHFARIPALQIENWTQL